MSKNVLIVSNSSEEGQWALEAVQGAGFNGSITEQGTLPELKGVDAVVWDQQDGESGSEFIQTLRHKDGNFLPVILVTQHGDYKMSFQTWACNSPAVRSGDGFQLQTSIKQSLQ
ncbi:MAG: hypothetical protein G3M78_10435 [Candidatus Nitrohelix vancouverensis]|uniref:Response regulatory domain-containing protein n=1 Tax=Candidatus Nitrohelix vancouverensis TaxID=2705534 RepID=A0A7T0C3B3_9BACT|nr:MAG: hypothetical protein G3M78_10435 [Candidatus Nitrohelix vancouverensis]